MCLPRDVGRWCLAGTAGIAMLWCVGAAPSHAVILAGGDQGANTTPPANDPGWYNVGQHGGGSAVYLGDRWVITADHLRLQDAISFNGIPVPVETGSEVVLRNPAGLGMSELTDLRLVRLAGDPGLPALTISSEPPPIEGEVAMIGRGRDREEALTLWDVTTFGGETVWTSVASPPYDESGYLWTTVQTMRWGTNVIEDDVDIRSGEYDLDHTIIADVEDIDVVAIGTRFDELNDEAATPFEGHATLGDSGGGVFYDNGNQWELAGIMLAVSVLEGQPEDTAVFGNLTVSADLSAYRDQILSIMFSRPALEAGDANQDLTFDQLDLVKVAQSAKYLTGEPASWGEGDWNGAPGGSTGSPPSGDGVFNQLDIVAAQQNGLYLQGPYAARPQQSIWETTLGSSLPSLGAENAAPENRALPDLDEPYVQDERTGLGRTGLAAVAGADALVNAGELENAPLHYVPVPEPSTLGLLAMALAVGICGRRIANHHRRLISSFS